ncbi:uncharacterized protein PHALS_15330 [Plasmopara halstedii]|uniref:Uncharacterized protein n=1 Tax=Plasmopara halstedii TaxID=4781 RepID=A0A0P1ACS6_PLAHL|nr:uncharacterized protein PHALS_15330 [Plasmopara halstedii]CEG38719.1 hypothetical protein PHALS_15330 [Plasmopara halstedii]|eukprot:XP_024575088.1 hypothetical protein PHALS_15330 [Plasmopara halstedii]
MNLCFCRVKIFKYNFYLTDKHIKAFLHSRHNTTMRLLMYILFEKLSCSLLKSVFALDIEFQMRATLKGYVEPRYRGCNGVMNGVHSYF